MIDRIDALLKRNPLPDVEAAHISGFSTSGGSMLLVREWLEFFGYEVTREKTLSDGRTGFMLDRCPFNSQHTGTEAMIMQWPSGKTGFKCQHASCAAYGWQEAMQAIGIPKPEHWYPPKISRSNSTNHRTTPTDNKAPAIRQFKFLNGRELAEGDFTIDFLINGVFVKNQPGIGAGPSKGMKTTVLGCDLGLSLATATPVLNRFTVQVAQRVGFMTGESGLGTIQETIARIARLKNLVPGDYADSFFVCDDVPFINCLPDLNGVEHAIRELDLDVLITDPAYQMLDGSDAGNLMKMGQQLKQLGDLCKAEIVTPLILHHSKGTSQNARDHAPLGLEDIAWSGFAEFARQWFLLNRREAYSPGTGFHRLWLSYGGSAGHSGLWAVDVTEGTNTAAEGRDYRIEVMEADEARHEIADQKAEKREAKTEFKRKAALQSLGDRIMDAFPNRVDWLSKTKLKERVGSISGEKINEGVAYLLRAGKVESKKDTITGVERDVYRPKN